VRSDIRDEIWLKLWGNRRSIRSRPLTGATLAASSATTAPERWPGQ